MDAQKKLMVSSSDIAKMADVGRSVVSNWRNRHDDFPSPVGGTDTKPLFDRSAVISWLKETGRKVRSENPAGELQAAMNVLRGSLLPDHALILVLIVSAVRASSRWVVEGVEERAEAVDNVPTADLLSALSIPEELSGSSGLPQGFQSSHLRFILDLVKDMEADELIQATDQLIKNFSRTNLSSSFGAVGSTSGMLLAEIINSREGSVYDPACGIADALLRVDGAEERDLIGGDIDGSAVLIAKLRSLIRGVTIDLHLADVLAKDPVPDLKADNIIIEPPMGMRNEGTKIGDRRFAYGSRRGRPAEFLWMQHALYHLSENGRAYVFTTSGVLSSSHSDDVQLRRNLLNAGCVEAIVSLPAGILPYTRIAPALWVLRPATTSTEVLFIDGTGVKASEKHVATWLNSSLDEVGDVPHVAVPMKEIVAEEADLSPVRWIGELAVDVAEIRERFSAAVAGLNAGFQSPMQLDLDATAVSKIGEAPVVSVKELIKRGAVERYVGRAPDVKEVPSEQQGRVVDMATLRTGVLGQVDGLAEIEGIPLTEQGDVLVATIRELTPVVDLTGGHILAGGIEALRVKGTEELLPAYLALMLSGSWNLRFIGGTTMPRIPIRELEIPVPSLSEQRQVVQLFNEISRLENLVKENLKHLSSLREAGLETIRFNAGEKRA